MGTLLDRLAAEEILPAKTALDLREYISKKHPSLSLASKAAVFSDAVNRILNDKIPGLPEDRLKKFKVALFRDAAGKAVFCINGSDIFKSALRLRMTDEPFVTALGDWLEKTLKVPVDRDKVSGFITSAHTMMDESPDMELDRLIGLAEQKVGGIVPDSGGKAAAEQKVGGIVPDSGEKAAVEEKACGIGPDIGKKAVVEQKVGGIVPDSGEKAVVEQNETESRVLPFVIADSDKESESGLQITGNETKTFTVRTMPAESLQAKGKALKAIAAVGLVVVSVLLSYYSALYINAMENTGLSRNGNVAMIEKEELHGGAVVPADPSDGGSGILKMTATAYDLSFESCGKERSSPAYGVTSSGTRATAGRTIAVDPEVIPLGSRVKITFPEKYSYLDGIYMAEDTGRLIKGNKVDVFFGEDKAGSRTVNKLAMDFGVQDVEVEILE